RLRALPVHEGRPEEEVPRLREEHPRTPHRPRRRNPLQGRRVLRDRLPLRLLQEGRRRRQTRILVLPLQRLLPLRQEARQRVRVSTHLQTPPTCGRGRGGSSSSSSSSSSFSSSPTSPPGRGRSAKPIG